MLQGIGYSKNVTLGTNFTIPSNATVTPGSFANDKITLASGFEINDYLTIKGLRDGGYTGSFVIGNAFSIAHGTTVPSNLFADATTTFVSGFKTRNI